MTRTRRPATLRAIADDLGLHVSTVARVLNDKREGTRAASGATAERIRRRAAEVGYRPNPQAASLRTQRSNLVGVLVPNLTDVVLATVYAGIEAGAGEHGLTAFVANTLDVQQVQRARIETMLDRRVDGLILGDVRSDDPAVLDVLARKGIPFVLVNRGVNAYPASTCDNYRGGRIAAEHLLELGHTCVGIIGGLAHASTGIDRPAGFIDRYREAGVEIPPTYLIHSGLDSAGGHYAADQLLDLDPQPTALFAVNDFAAIGAAGTIQQRGLRVGHDIGLIGFNNTDLASELHTPLTSIDSSPAEMGRTAIDMLVALLDGRQIASQYTEPRLVVRDSTKPRH